MRLSLSFCRTLVLVVLSLQSPLLLSGCFDSAPSNSQHETPDPKKPSGDDSADVLIDTDGDGVPDSAVNADSDETDDTTDTGISSDGTTTVPLADGDEAAIFPTAVITGIEDGGVYGPGSLDASSIESENATSVHWDICDGATAATTNDSPVFQFSVAAGTDCTLTLTVTSATKHTAQQSIVIHSAAPPVAKISVENLASGGTWPLGYALQLSATKSTGYITKYQWNYGLKGKLHKIVTKSAGEDTTLLLESTEAGLYDVTLIIYGPGGSTISEPFLFTVAEHPIAKITGITDGEYGVDQTLTFSGKESSVTGGSIIEYQWKVRSEIETVELLTKATGETLSYAFTTPGHYVVELRVVANIGGYEDASNINTVHFTILPKPTVTISGADKPAYAIGKKIFLEATGENWGTKYTHKWSVIKSPVPVELPPGEFFQFIPPEAGDYIFAFEVTGPGGSATAEVSIVAKPLPIAHISSSEIEDGYAYPPLSVLKLSAATSLDASEYLWSVINDKGVVESTYPGQNLEIKPTGTGQYTIQLVAKNALGSSAPESWTINIRKKIFAQLAGIDPGPIAAMHVLGPDNIYLVGQSILHYGKDGRWIVLQENVNAVDVCARNASDVWVAGNNGVWRITAKDGIAYSSVDTAGKNIAQIACADFSIVIRAEDGKTYASQDNKTWQPLLPDIARITGDKASLYTLNTQGVVTAYHANQGSEQLGTLDAIAVYHFYALARPDQDPLIVVTAMNGEIYVLEQKAFQKIGTLPFQAGVQAQDRAMSLSGNDLSILTQTGKVVTKKLNSATTIYTLKPGINNMQAPAGALLGEARYLVSNDGTFYAGQDLASDWQGTTLAQSPPTYPSGYTGSGLDGIRAGTGAMITNLLEPELNWAKRILHIPASGSLAYVQTAANKASPYPPTDAAWSTPDGSITYFLSKDPPNTPGIYKIENGTVSLVKATADFVKEVEVLKDIQGRSANEFYVLSNKRLYRTLNAGQSIEVLPLVTGNYIKLYVSHEGFDKIVVLNEAEDQLTWISNKSGTEWANAFLPTKGYTHLAGNTAGDLLIAFSEKQIARYDAAAKQWKIIPLPKSLDVASVTLNDVMITASNAFQVTAGPAKVLIGSISASTMNTWLLYQPAAGADCVAPGSRGTWYYCEKQPPVDGVTNVKIHQFGPMQ